MSARNITVKHDTTKNIKTYTTTITQEMTNYLQRMNYDVDQYEKNTRLLIIEGGADIIKNEAFKYYKTEASELNFELQILKAEIERLILPVGFTLKHAVTWSVDYFTNIVTVDVSCDCGIKVLEEAGYELK